MGWKNIKLERIKGSSQLTLSDGTTFPVQIRYQITVKSTDGEDNIFAFTDTAETSYDFSNELENDIPANENSVLWYRHIMIQKIFRMHPLIR